jgi:hypothetical protein
MNQQKILERIEELKQRSTQLQADLNAVGGALQDCEYWLDQVSKQESSDETTNSNQVGQ